MDCQGQFGSGFGALELPAAQHDARRIRQRHDGRSRGASAEDPIFFSFHCYIDLLWAQWQENNETDTDLDARLCGLFKDREHLEENRFRVRDTLDTEKSSATSTEYTPGPRRPASREALRRRLDLPGASGARRRRRARATAPALVRTLELDRARAGRGGRDAAARQTSRCTTPFSYGADIYLTPAGEELRTEDRAFRARYLADVLYFWKSHHSHGDNTHNITVDLGRVIEALSPAAHAGE